MKSPNHTQPETKQGPLTERAFATRSQLKAWNTRGYRISGHGNEYSAVVVGEQHDVSRFITKQLELALMLRPEYVLHEFLKAWIYDPETGEFTRQPGRLISQAESVLEPEVPQEFVQLSNQQGFKIVGCDLTHTELDPAAEYTEFMDTEEIPEPKPVQTVINDPARDKKMAQTIIEYANQSLRPILAVVGAKHSTAIRKRMLLEGHGFGYAIVDQTKSSIK